ncbi:hypothetical protein Ndes2526B_g00595 [Nannochloris sp. 'desiccata']|nr:putative Multiple myeloma tumor-associated protein 2-like protein [Chlorella desiccata (nom. nud.)]
MAGIFNGPPRGGTRGGRSEFSWDNVKADQSREYYLGHSVKAVTGRWAKGKDVYWYTRDKEEGESADIRRENEMAMVKQREQDLMMEALGMKPKAPKHESRQPRLDQEDMKKLLGKNQDEDYQNQAGPSGEGAGIRGLGYNASRTTGAVQSGVDQERLDGVGMQRPSGNMPPTGIHRNPVMTAAAPPTKNEHGAELKLQNRHQSREEMKDAKGARKESRREKKRSSRKDSGKREKRKRQMSRSRSPERRGRERKYDIGMKHSTSSDSEDSRDRKHRRSRRRNRSRSRGPGEEYQTRQRRHWDRSSRSRSRSRGRDRRN